MIGLLSIGRSLRSPGSDADSAVLYALHKAPMREYVEAIYGPWDDDVQFAMHKDWLQALAT